MSVPDAAPPAPPAPAVPTRARVLAARLAALFEAEQKIVVALNDAHHLLAAANDRLWTDPVVDPLSVHQQIHRAFCAYQHASEQRRQLAVDVGELSQQLTDTLTAAGYTPSRPAQRTSTSSRPAPGNRPKKERRANDERSRRRPKRSKRLVEAHARELHLPAIRTRFRALAAEAVREQQTPLAYLAALLEAEVTERAERREKTPAARRPVPAHQTTGGLPVRRQPEGAAGHDRRARRGLLDR